MLRMNSSAKAMRRKIKKLAMKELAPSRKDQLCFLVSQLENLIGNSIIWNYAYVSTVFLIAVNGESATLRFKS